MRHGTHDPTIAIDESNGTQRTKPCDTGSPTDRENNPKPVNHKRKTRGTDYGGR